MNILYFDCFAGISGDMTLGALVDVGVDFDILKAELSKLNLEGYDITCERKVKKGISAVDITIDIHHPNNHSHSHHSHRSFTDIKNIIESSNLNDRVKRDAVGIFRILGEAEAKVHGVDIEKIHFHEVGAVDSIVDIVGVCICIDMLKIDEVYCSKLPIFYGTVQIAHGTFPLPAPATIEILKNVPFTGDGIEGEIITPTGAAILKYFSKDFGNMPAMTIKNTGYGAGKKDFGLPNVLRVISGEKSDKKEESTIAVIEANNADHR
ncbi:MAG: nickel pincer cofactor biosynthesis protein LarC, partial [Armatimonadota bacterium]